MKNLTISVLLFFLCTSVYSSPFLNRISKKEKEMLQVEKLDRASNLFKSENLFFSGQPNLETLEWLQSQGVNTVINLRSEGENEDFAESAFNEEQRVENLGMKYISIPIDGYDSYTTENVAKLAEAIEILNGKALIHCASCGRVSYFMMAYLIDHKNYSLEEAVAFGEQMKFHFPLEYLLHEEIQWKLK